MKLATWNVNSVRARLPHVLDWLSSASPDVLCLQETKVVDADFPYLPIQAAGYRGYCEVEILSAQNWWKRDPDEVVRTIKARFATAM